MRAKGTLRDTDFVLIGNDLTKKKVIIYIKTKFGVK